MSCVWTVRLGNVRIMDATPPLDEALDYYLEARTGDRSADLIAAIQEAARRRAEGPSRTRVILMALLDEGRTYREIEELSVNPVTGDRISRSTAHAVVTGQRR